MRGISSVCAGVALLASASFAMAEAHRPAAVAIWSAEICLRMGDAAFEQSLRDGVGTEDQAALMRVADTATFECLGLSMEICEGRLGSLGCLGDLATWVGEDRLGLVALLPETLEVEGYAEALARAGAAADEAECDGMTDREQERYCGVVAEGMALEDAYFAWRMARRDGAADLVGHDPVNLELIR